MQFNMVYFAIGLLLPMTLAVQLPEPKLGLAAVDKPKMGLAVVGHSADSFAKMEAAFARSTEVHEQAMEEISKTLTLPKALDVVQKSAIMSASSLSEVTSLLAGDSHLRKAVQGKGFGGLEGARKLLNSMIYEAMSKYDAEIARCTDYYAKQCALMEVARGQISAANFVAANARGLILDAQGNINQMEKDIPDTKQELKDHNALCKTDIKKLNAKLKIIMEDIAVMTMILEMSDCDKKGFVQTKQLAMLHCKDQCSAQELVSFNHNKLQKELDRLQSKDAKDLLSNAFQDLFNDGDEVDATEFVQVDGSDYKVLAPPKVKKGKSKPAPKKTKFNNPPVPMTKVPTNPCTDPNQGAPAASKRGAKCSLKKSPKCYKLQARFLQLQAGIADTRDELMDQIAKKEHECEETKSTLESSIATDSSSLSSSQTKLAEATQKESSSGETGRQVSKENDAYNADLVKTMKTCTDNYNGFENEMCALKKIRGDLFKKKQKGHTGFFQDCEVTKWSPEACTKKCAGGEQKVVRSVMNHPAGGSKCLPLKAMRSCNVGPCPINCKLAAWSGWNKCSSKCGGGVSQRVREVKRAAQHKGTPCGGTSESKQCNVAACSKDCVLHPWTAWTGCSKDCDGGTKKRQRMIKHAAQGSGKCAGEWDKKRLQYNKCARHSCKVADPNGVLKCNQSLDILLLLDATPRSGKKGWAAEVKAANLFVDAFTGKGITAKPNFAVLHYTGPRTWSGVSKCTGKSTKKVDMEKDCHVKIAHHFTDNLKEIKTTISGLQYQAGSKLLSLALMTVQAELPLGNPIHRTVVVVFVDGEPLSYRKTKLASLAVRKKARLVWVPVKKFSALKDMKTWASRRWQENIVSVADIETLAKPETGTHIIANICPKAFPKLKNVVKKR